MGNKIDDDEIVKTKSVSESISRKQTSKNAVPFRSWISKINNTLVGNAEDFAIIILMYNLLE